MTTTIVSKTKLFRVLTLNKVRPWRTVEASYFSIVDGALIFKLPSYNSYPIVVHVFARGCWQQVKCGDSRAN